MATYLTCLAVAKLNLDRTMQPRAVLNAEAVQEYGERYRDRLPMPPIVVFSDGETWWLADGWHRVQGATTCRVKQIEAEVHAGGRREAILWAVNANSAHGVQRTPEDKRRAVGLLLDDPEWAAWSDRTIAEACRVGNSLVSEMRRARRASVYASRTDRTEVPAGRKCKRNGTVYTIKPKRITFADDAQEEVTTPWTEDEFLDQSAAKWLEKLQARAEALDRLEEFEKAVPAVRAVFIVRKRRLERNGI